jgi:multidrug efflux system outer membrane protein
MKNKFIPIITIAGLFVLFSACQLPKITSKSENKLLPSSYKNTLNADSSNTVLMNWQAYFSDTNLQALIDTALRNNQELNIVLQEIEISKNEVTARKGEYLPFVGIRGGAGIEKEGRYTRHGAVDENIDIKEGTPFPDPLQDYLIGAYASWELDIWKKLRNARKSAAFKYLATIEGKNFMITNLVAEIANNYYELMALDNLLEVIKNNIEIQDKVFQIVKQQKEAGKLSLLAVNRFEAQVLNTKNRQYDVIQNIVETENRINALVGRFPQSVNRNAASFKDIKLDSVILGIPVQLLENRPDIRQAESELEAAKLDIAVTKANFYPSLNIQSSLGLQAFNPALLFRPESILYSLGAEIMAPLVNRNAIKSTYYNANAKEIQAVYNYEQKVLNAYIDVVNQLAKFENYKKSYDTKMMEVNLLNQSISISNSLFNSARADYMEVLLTQREALESTVDLIEIKLKQTNAKVKIYQALGGGWN